MLRLGRQAQLVSLFIFIYIVNSLAFVFPVDPLRPAKISKNRALLWKQAPEQYARSVFRDDYRGAQGTSWGVLFLPQSLEVRPEHLPVVTTNLGPSGSKYPQVTFGRPCLAALRHGPLSVALHIGQGPVVSRPVTSKTISVQGDR